MHLAFLVRAVNDVTKSSFSDTLERAEKKLLTVLKPVARGLDLALRSQAGSLGVGQELRPGRSQGGAQCVQEMLVA